MLTAFVVSFASSPEGSSSGGSSLGSFGSSVELKFTTALSPWKRSAARSYCFAASSLVEYEPK